MASAILASWSARRPPESSSGRRQLHRPLEVPGPGPQTALRDLLARRASSNAPSAGRASSRPPGRRSPDYYEGWIDSYRGRTARGLEETTRASYRDSFDRHVIPFPIARQKMRDVTSRDVSDWFGDLERKHVGARSISKAKAALSVMLATAAQAGDIPANPATGVRYVPTTRSAGTEAKRRTLTVEDVAAHPRRARAELAAVLRAARNVRATGRRGARAHVATRPPRRRPPHRRRRTGLPRQAQASSRPTAASARSRCPPAWPRR